MQIDFDRTSRDYARYRVPFAPALIQRLGVFGIGLPNQQILDLGAGTGLFADAIAQSPGFAPSLAEHHRRGNRVALVDVSHALLAHSHHAFRAVAAAETLPFADDTFDVVTAAQCWHWFDRHRAPREILRVLHSGGALVVVYQTHIPLPGSVAEASEKLILRHHPGWRHANSTGINGQVLRDVQAAGFVQIESFSFDIEVQFTHESWRGFIRTTSAVGASMPPAQIEQFDREHAELLRDFPQILRVPHRVFAAIARKSL